MASGDGKDVQRTNTGLRIYMGGMGLQQVFLLFFLFLLVSFHRQMRSGHVVPRSERWQPLTYLSYTAVGLITLRIVFRMAEFANGVESEVAKKEALLYVFDALPMLVCIVMFSIYHPSRTFKGLDGEFPKLSRNEKKEIKRQKKEEKKARKMGKFTDDLEMGARTYQRV